MSGWIKPLHDAVSDLAPEMSELRRHLHRNPEVSGQEFATSLLVYRRFDELGLPVELGPEGCGVIVNSSPQGEADNGQTSPNSQQGNLPGLIALRADLDALRIHDAKQVPYRSQCDGVMHACGHDAHTAIVIGAATALEWMRREKQLPWPVRWRGIFQPAEETCEGATAMIGIGAMQGVDAIMGVHVDPSRSVGRIGLRSGALTASADLIRFRITGRGGHAARPHESVDSIATAAQLISSLYLFVPRMTDSQDSVVLTIGEITGGDNPNVIPEEVHLAGTLRTLDAEVRDRTFRHIERLARGLGETSEAQIDIRVEMSAPSVNNDAALLRYLSAAGDSVIGLEQIDTIPRPSMGSEDFAFYLEHAPGCMFRLGCASPEVGSAGLHSANFDIDERALAIGAKILAETVIRWSNPQRDIQPTTDGQNEYSAL
ncbi:MAG: amidohydrolase [Pirellulales bacterium]|nr:amidohydrolase [Pirellulales bacterium]